jgi:hypothetical protein
MFSVLELNLKLDYKVKRQFKQRLSELNKHVDLEIEGED